MEKKGFTITLILLRSISILLICLVVSCNSSSIDVKNKNYNDLIKELGYPKNECKVKLYKKVSLYEYQNELYNFVPNSDTVVITESVWQLSKKLVVWHSENKILGYIEIEKNIKY